MLEPHLLEIVLIFVHLLLQRVPISLYLLKPALEIIQQRLEL